MAEPQIDLRRLRYFMAVAEASSFKRAAERLGIAQPPLSQQIMALEEQLGQRLFIRHPRNVELTEAGEALRGLAEPLLAAAATIPERVARAAKGHGGILRIGFTPGAALHPLLPRALQAFRSEVPDVELQFEEGDTTPLCDRVADGQLQVAFIRPPAPARDRLRVEPILVEPILAALPHTHRLARLPRPTLADFADEDLVMFERSLAPAIYDAILTACAAAGFSPRIVHHAPQKASAMMLVAGGAGVTFVPASMRGIQADALALVALSGPQPAVALGIATRHGEQGILAQRFRTTILALSAAWDGSGPA